MTHRLLRTVAGIALAAASLLAAPATPAAATTPTAVCAPGAVYAVGDDGSLNWWSDADPAATGGFSARRSVGNGWADFSQITAGGGGVIYAVDGDVLRWYRHTDPTGGSASWAPGSGKIIGPAGWRSVSYVLSAGNGVLLTVNRDDHNMRWYRYTDPVGGNGSWASGSGKTIGNNWTFTNVFSGGAGIVYAVTDKGALLWYRYSDPYNGNGAWSSTSIGQGWGFTSYLPEGGGVIYGIRPTGQLGSYQHTDPYSGAATWITHPDYGSGWTTYTHHAPPTSDTSTCAATDRADTGFVKTLTRGWLSRFGWSDEQFACLDQIWIHESNWRWDAENPSSGAYGVPQSLPASKMASAGPDYLTNPLTQIAWGLGYIQDRYATPCDAWSFWQNHHWY